MKFFSLSQRSVLPWLRGQDRAELLRSSRAPETAAGRDVRRDLRPVLQRAQRGLGLRGRRGHPQDESRVEVDRGVVVIAVDLGVGGVAIGGRDEEEADDERGPRLVTGLLFYIFVLCSNY